MNARYALIPILGASALLLSGCFSTLQPAVAPQSSTTDPIAEAQYIQYNTSTRANALINFGGLDKDYAVEETASHRMFDHVWLANPVIFQDHLTLDAAQLEARFSNIYALVVEPGSESESSFYEHFGFRKCKSGEIPILFFEIGNSEVGNDDGKSKRMTTKERKELQSILAKITPENLHTRMDFGNTIGNEQL